MRTTLELFFGGFLQTIILGFNIRNISRGSVMWSLISAFFLAIVWGFVVQEIVRDLNGFWHIVSYACGASIGTGCAVYLAKKDFFSSKTP